jgi:predicted HAD superfamily Cof-like phosphohydrolase
MLDADIDLSWVTIGSALSQGADVEGAVAEVARSNLAKLVKCHCTSSGCAEPCCGSCNGLGLVAIKDANGKVRKPEGWVAPNITPFINTGVIA